MKKNKASVAFAAWLCPNIQQALTTVEDATRSSRLMTRLDSDHLYRVTIAIERIKHKKAWKQ